MNKIKGAFISLSTQRGDDESYAAWLQLVRLPTRLTTRGVSGAQGWFASPGCMASSGFRDGPMAGARHLQCFLFEGSADVLASLRDGDTGSVSTPGHLRTEVDLHVDAPFQLVRTYASPRALVDPESVAFRRNTGVYLIIERLRRTDTLDQWRVHQHRENINTILTIPGVVGAWTFGADGYASSQIAAYGMPKSDLHITLLYLDDDPIAVSQMLKSHLAIRWSHAPVTPLLAGAYRSFFPPPDVWCAPE